MNLARRSLMNTKGNLSTSAKLLGTWEIATVGCRRSYSHEVWSRLYGSFHGILGTWLPDEPLPPETPDGQAMEPEVAGLKQGSSHCSVRIAKFCHSMFLQI